jgi:DNA-damage-inducible protein D
MTDTPLNSASLLAEISFGDVLEKISTPEARQLAVETNASMKDGAIEKLILLFEDAAKSDEGSEYWDARDLQKLLDYSDYRNFLNIVDKAKVACKTTGFAVEDHFVDATDMIDIGKGALREVDTINLSRYACYLIAQNGDPRKLAVAFAQTYFAIQTRRQEIQDKGDTFYSSLTEDERRIFLRDEMKLHNKKLASAARHAGVIASIDFAIFQNSGYQGLYNGLDCAAIRRRKGITKRQDILNHMGSTELAANLFRATQTEEKLTRDNIRGKEAANQTHNAVGREVRQAIANVGGIMPEELPVAEDISRISRRHKKAIADGGAKSL